MEIKEVLQNELINKSELARLMYPDMKGSVVYLYQKLAEQKTANSHRRLTQKDIAKAKAILHELGNQLLAL